MSFGARLRELRLCRHLSQEALAEALDLTSKTIRRWEQELAIPRPFARQQLARFFDLPAEELFEDLEPLTVLPWMVPFPRHPFFTGREQILRTLSTRLTAEQPIALTQAPALCGLGGIGKTQVAVEYAYRSVSEYCAVFWLEAETQESLMRSLAHIVEQLQLPEREEVEQAQIVSAVKRWLATHPGWLLIADNVEELDLLQMVFPARHQGAILLTTRRQALGPLVEPLKLPPMSDEEGVTLLLRRSRQLEESTPEAAPTAVEGASELVKLLEGLPLALDQAGAYLEETGCSVSDYLERYRRQRKHILARRGLHEGVHPASVSTTLSLSIQQIKKAHPAAEDLLCVCAFLHPEAIPEEMLVKGASHLGPELSQTITDAYQFDLLLAALRNASLMTRSPATRILSVHRLVQAVLADQMEPDLVRLWSERVVRMVNAVFPNAAFPDMQLGLWVQCERLLPQVMACYPLIESAGSDLPESGEVLYKAGGYLLARGRYCEADPLLSQAVTLAEQQHGSDHPMLISRLEKQAELFWHQGKYEFVEQLLQRALVLEMHHMGLHHSRTAETLSNLAVLYSSQGKYERAERLYQRALHIQKQQLGHEHFQVSTILNNLAYLYWRQGKYEEAEPLYKRALCIREQQLGPDHPSVGITINSLANLYREQGKYEEAEPLYQQALAISEQHLGAPHPQTIEILADLAALYQEQGKYEEAEPLYQQALAISEQRLGSTHPKTRKIRDDYHRLLEQRTSASQRADEEQQDHFSSGTSKD